MIRRLVLAAVAAAVAVAILALWPNADQSERSPVLPVAAPTPPAVAERDALAAVAVEVEESRAAASAADPARGSTAPVSAEQILRVRVLSTVDEPLAQSSIELRAWDEPSGPGRPLALERVGPGLFEARLDRGLDRFEYTARAPGRRAKSFFAAPTAEPVLSRTERLEPSGEVVFVAVDGDGQPVPSATARVTYADGSPPREFEQHEFEGAFALQGIGGDRLRVVLQSAGVGRSEFSVDLPWGVEPLDLGAIPLVGRGVLRGRLVVDGGNAVPGARIRAQHLGGSSQGLIDQEVETGPEGRFEFRGLAAGQFELSVDPEFDPFGSTTLVAEAGVAAIEWVSDAALVEFELEPGPEAPEALGNFTFRLGDDGRTEDVPLAGRSHRDMRFLLPRGTAIAAVAAVWPATDFAPATVPVYEGELPASAESVRRCALYPTRAESAELMFEVERNSDGPIELRLTLERAGAEARSFDGSLSAQGQVAVFRGLPPGSWTVRLSAVAADRGTEALVFVLGAAGSGRASMEVQLEPSRRTRAFAVLVESAEIAVDLPVGGTAARLSIVPQGGAGGEIDVVHILSLSEARGRAGAIVTDFDRSRRFYSTGPVGRPTLEQWTSTNPVTVERRVTEAVPIGRYRVRVDADGWGTWEREIDLTDPDQWIVRAFGD